VRPGPGSRPGEVEHIPDTAASPAYSQDMDLASALHAYEKAVLASRPVAWWRLGEKAGPIAFDAMQKHDGKYCGKVIFSQTRAVKHDPNRA
jgi:hypothetical protein